MRNGAHDGADDGGALRHAIRPRRHDVADIVVNPCLAADDAFALEAHRPWRAVADRSVEIERPARPVDAPLEHAHRRILDADIAASEFELVERGRHVRIVQQASIGPYAGETADVRALSHANLSLALASRLTKPGRRHRSW